MPEPLPSVPTSSLPPREASTGPDLPSAPSAAVTTSPDLGRYVDLQFHARGGLGEVHRAQDTELHRTVAIKRIQERHADNPASRRRFLLEAEVTARLEHPGVVPVYYGLLQDSQGRPGHAMRFIQGQTLGEAIQRFHEPGECAAPAARNLAFRQLLQRYIALCQISAYAHSRGVIHRDLKPGNVLLGPYGETLLVDWGLAKALGRT